MRTRLKTVLSWVEVCVTETAVRWAGVAKNMPHSSARPLRAIQYGLADEWGTLLAAPAHSPRVVEWPVRQCCSGSTSWPHSICPPTCNFLFYLTQFCGSLVRLLAGISAVRDVLQTTEIQLLPNSLAWNKKCEVICAGGTGKAIVWTTGILCPAWQWVCSRKFALNVGRDVGQRWPSRFSDCRYEFGERKTVVRVPSEADIFSLLRSNQTGPATYPASCVVFLTVQLLVTTLKIYGTLPPLPNMPECDGVSLSKRKTFIIRVPKSVFLILCQTTVR